jgi:alkanesulfonate monooxygenase
VTDSTIVDQKRYGEHLPHDERYKRTNEFLEIIKCIWQNKFPVTFKGQYYDIADITFFSDVVFRPFPPVYLGGSSEAGRLVGGKHSDIHMMYAAKLESIAKGVIDMKQRAAEFGREN